MHIAEACKEMPISTTMCMPAMVVPFQVSSYWTAAAAIEQAHVQAMFACRKDPIAA